MSEAKKPHRSTSQLESYSRCAEAFRRRYIEKEIIPPGIALMQGKGVDAAQGVNFRQKIETHEDLPVSEIKDAAAAAFDNETAGEYLLSTEEVTEGPKKVLGRAKDQTVKLAEAFAIHQAPDYQPVAVQREFRIVMPNSTHDLIGFIDLECDQKRVTDFKTANKRKNQDEVNSSLQLTVYAAAHRLWTGSDPTEVRLDTLVKNKEPVRQVLASSRSLDDYQALVNRFNAIQQAIAAGNFPPATPGAWWCGPKWCGYHATCPYVNSSPVTVQITIPEPLATEAAT